MLKIIFASKNPGKVKEIREIFQGSAYDIKSLNDLNGSPEIIEDGNTFEENAEKKAKEIFDYYKVPVISDDSGFAVEQLNWMPGVYSARFAGDNATDDANNEKLIASVKQYPEPHIAKYVCSAVFYDGKNVIIERGEIYGRIITTARGHNGFGYDPYFVPDGYNKTMAELDPDEKNRISHRGIAFKKLKKKMLERQIYE